ncbi:UNVERIFIED_CONTAM: hypothetical protein GTU68_058202 [Idotea baltica]|nr:hypothetical protein [Idotea baltica]
MIAAANVYTAKEHGPDRIIGFSPIPAMSMVSYAAGSRYLEVRYKGAKGVVITPDYSEAAKLADMWLNPKQGTDAAVAMAFGHVILKEFHLDNPSAYFTEYVRQYSDMPNLVTLEPTEGGYKSTRFLRASDLANNLGQENNPDWKTIALDELSGELVSPQGSIGYRWGEQGDGKAGGSDHWEKQEGESIQMRNVPTRTITLADGSQAKVATVYDLMMANYGIDRGLGGEHVASSFDDDTIAYTPAWQEKITGVPRAKIVQVAREFAANADKTRGKSMINMLIMCGCVGQSGGGWAHYVGQEKLRPQTGWLPLAFGLDWSRPPRQMNSTSFFYSHSSQWRHEKVSMHDFQEHMLDYNIKAERMGWLPSAPQLNRNPLQITRDAEAAGNLKFAAEQPDNPDNFPRNMFIWRSNLLGSSGKGHEYMLKYLLGTKNGVMNEDNGVRVVTLDFRMSSTCMYSDIVLPTATWYEKDDLNTSDMHPFIHPLSKAADPAWEARSDWDIYKGIAKKFSEISAFNGNLGIEKDFVTVPMLHDTPGELAQPYDVKDWKHGECDLIPGATAPNMVVVERDYPNTYKKFTSLGPLLEKMGNGAETNGNVAVKAWDALGQITGRDHKHLAEPKHDEKIRFRDIQAQPRKIISSPTWSGLEDEHVSYNACYTNVHELIPWRTITGRQQFYQDHKWMEAFGEQLISYRPPIHTNTIDLVKDKKSNGNKEIVLNWITPHQKWGIHSTYSDNLLMLTLSRGGPIIWLSEIDAQKADIKDNDWVEVFNVNGAIACRAVVSQRVKEGMVMMYHAQERIVNVPGSETTGTRGGHHNSVTRIVMKPTHMIGGYAQQSYGFNYYGTVGCNRDEMVVVRKMDKVDWLDNETGDGLPQPLPTEV